MIGALEDRLGSSAAAAFRSHSQFVQPRSRRRGRRHNSREEPAAGNRFFQLRNFTGCIVSPLRDSELELIANRRTAQPSFYACPQASGRNESAPNDNVVSIEYYRDDALVSPPIICPTRFRARVVVAADQDDVVFGVVIARQPHFKIVSTSCLFNPGRIRANSTTVIRMVYEHRNDKATPKSEPTASTANKMRCFLFFTSIPE